jgi:hypothetical protein
MMIYRAPITTYERMLLTQHPGSLSLGGISWSGLELPKNMTTEKRKGRWPDNRGQASRQQGVGAGSHIPLGTSRKWKCNLHFAISPRRRPQANRPRPNGVSRRALNCPGVALKGTEHGALNPRCFGVRRFIGKKVSRARDFSQQPDAHALLAIC